MSYSPKQDAVERILPPVEIGTFSNDLSLVETVGGTDNAVQIVVPEGSYFCFHRQGPNHDTPAATGVSPTWKTGFDGLYRDICNRLNAQTTGSTAGGGYQIEWVPPASGDFSYASTVRLFHTDPNVDAFEIDKDSGLLDYLGLNAGAGPSDPQLALPIQSSGDGSGLQEIVGRQTARGVWTSPRIASFKRSFTTRDIKHTEIDFERATHAEWDEWIARVIEYQRLPGIHAVSDRARRPGYHEVGELGWWDVYNAFEDYWDLINDGSKFIVLYGSTWGGERPDGTTVDWPNANADIEVCDGNVTTANEVRSTVEIVKMFDDAEMSDFREVCATDENSSSEHYPLEMKLRCDPNQHWGY